MAFCVIAFLGNLEKGDNNAIWRFSFSPGGCSEGARKGGADTFHHQVGGLSHYMSWAINIVQFSETLFFIIQVFLGMSLGLISILEY